MIRLADTSNLSHSLPQIHDKAKEFIPSDTHYKELWSTTKSDQDDDGQFEAELQPRVRMSALCYCSLNEEFEVVS